MINYFFYSFFLLFLFFFNCQERELTTTPKTFLENKVLDLTILGFGKTNLQKETRSFNNIFLLNRSFNFTTFLEVENDPLEEIIWESGNDSILEVNQEGIAKMKNIGITTLKASYSPNPEIFHDVLLSVNTSTKNFVHLKISDIDKNSAKITFPPCNVNGISFYLTYQYYTNDFKKVKKEAFWQYTLPSDSVLHEKNLTALTQNSPVFGYFVINDKIVEKTFFVTSADAYYDANFSFSAKTNKWLDLSINKNDAFFSNGIYNYNNKKNFYQNDSSAFMGFTEIIDVDGIILQIDAINFADFTPFLGHHTEEKLKSGRSGAWINSDFKIDNSFYRSGIFWVDGQQEIFENFKISKGIKIYSLQMFDGDIKVSQTANKQTDKRWKGIFQRIIVYKNISTLEMDNINQQLYNFSQN